MTVERSKRRSLLALTFIAKVVFCHVQTCDETKFNVASHAVVFRGVVLPSSQGNTTALKTTAWEAKFNGESRDIHETVISSFSALFIGFRGS